jgi:hypothetical protein
MRPKVAGQLPSSARPEFKSWCSFCVSPRTQELDNERYTSLKSPFLFEWSSSMSLMSVLSGTLNEVF